MQFIRVEGWEQGIAALSQRLAAELKAGRRVLWLTSGGSNIAASVEIMASIPDELSPKLSVMPCDERYGPPGHADSNWAQLMTAGFDAKQATLLPVLKDGLGFEETAQAFESQAREAFRSSDVVICQLGMGPDGHVSGILPGSPAAEESEAWVSAYEAPPLRRITLTFPALRQVSAAYLFAFGVDKHQALARLQSESLSPAEQPAQILKGLGEAYIYNDQVGDYA